MLRFLNCTQSLQEDVQFKEIDSTILTSKLRKALIIMDGFKDGRTYGHVIKVEYLFIALYYKQLSKDIKIIRLKQA